MFLFVPVYDGRFLGCAPHMEWPKEERRGACGVRVALLDDDDAYEDGSIIQL